MLAFVPSAASQEVGLLWVGVVQAGKSPCPSDVVHPLHPIPFGQQK